MLGQRGGSTVDSHLPLSPFAEIAENVYVYIFEFWSNLRESRYASEKTFSRTYCRGLTYVGVVVASFIANEVSTCLIRGNGRSRETYLQHGRWESGKRRWNRTAWAREQRPCPPSTSRPPAAAAALAAAAEEAEAAAGAGGAEAGGEAGAAAAATPPSARADTAGAGVDRCV